MQTIPILYCASECSLLVKEARSVLRLQYSKGVFTFICQISVMSLLVCSILGVQLQMQSTVESALNNCDTQGGEKWGEFVAVFVARKRLFQYFHLIDSVDRHSHFS